jgi:hypothetical protein
MGAFVNKIWYNFPANWNKEKIVLFCNQDFKVCPYCGKIDIRIEHLNDCNETIAIRTEREDNYWK